jgi:hypothetical protein
MPRQPAPTFTDQCVPFSNTRQIAAPGSVFRLDIPNQKTGLHTHQANSGDSFESTKSMLNPRASAKIGRVADSVWDD